MQSKRATTRILGGLFALSLVAAGCGDDKDDEMGSSSNTTEAPSGAQDGVLKGMKGTTPLTDLDKLGDFKTRLDDAWGSTLDDYNYGAESYDIVNILALSAVAAKSDAPGMVAAQVIKTTETGEKCTDFKTCNDLLTAGKDIDYEGASGPTDLLPNGDPASGSYGILEFDENDEIQTDTYVVAESAAGAGADGPTLDPAFGPVADGILRIGTVLPVTGNLAFLGPPEFAGVKLAVSEINEAGGVLGKPVELVEGDSGDKTNSAFNTTVDGHLAKKVDAMVGAASSGVTLAFLDRVVAQGVIVFSPANTSKDLSVAPDKGLYFRLAPSDILQGQVLGDLVAEDGFTEVVVMNLQDPYGTGLAEDFKTAFEANSGKVVKTIEYKADATNFDAEVQEAVDANPEALILIGFEESAKILRGLIAKGKGPNDLPTYGVDGNMGNALAESLKSDEG